MKRIKHGILAAAMLTASMVIPMAAEAKAPDGSWIKDSKGSWYSFADGGWAKSEYINGYWIRKNGYWDGGAKFVWHHDKTGYWWGTADGTWYAKNEWQKIDGRWYYFDGRGYMAKNEYIKGYWVGPTGAWNPGYSHGQWVKGTGENEGRWWYKDKVGSSGKNWYPTSQWLRIDGYSYYFDEEGWMLQDTVEKLMCNPYGKEGSFAYLDYYAFENNGQLGTYTKFMLDSSVDATICFHFDSSDQNAKMLMASDMDHFLYFTLDEGEAKTLSINGVERQVEIGKVEDVDVVMIDDQSIYDWVESYTGDMVSISGTAGTKKIVEALSIGTIEDCLDYSFDVSINGFEMDSIQVDDDKVEFFSGDGYYYGMFDMDDDDVSLLIAGDVSEGLGVDLVTAGAIVYFGEPSANALVVDSATGHEVYCELIPKNEEK